MVADLIDMAVGRAQLTFAQLGLWEEQHQFPLLPAAESSSRYYLRLNVEDRPHVLADVADILGRHEISIASVIQHEAPEVDEVTSQSIVPLVIMTHRTTAGQLQLAETALHALPAVRKPMVRMRVAD